MIEVIGEVRSREEGTVNANLATGEIELFANEIIVHNQSKDSSLPLDDSADKVSEDLRLTYRYLDLRRETNLHALKLRHRASHAIRKYFNDQAFFGSGNPRFCLKHSGGCTRIPNPQPLKSRKILRPSPIPPAIQTDADGGRSGALLSISPLFSR